MQIYWLILTKTQCVFFAVGNCFSDAIKRPVHWWNEHKLMGQQYHSTQVIAARQRDMTWKCELSHRVAMETWQLHHITLNLTEEDRYVWNAPWNPVTLISLGNVWDCGYMPSLILANEHSKLQVPGDSQVQGQELTIINTKWLTVENESWREHNSADVATIGLRQQLNASFSVRSV